MPREKKKRGRREEEREKKRQLDERYHKSSKRFKHDNSHNKQASNEIVVSGDAGDDFIGFGIGPPQDIQEDQFHGLLDPEEQEYYSNVNNKIVANDFESAEDRAIFIDAVHHETQGKELKVASSQSGSRCLEKVILLSTPKQLRNLFSKFLGNLTYLVRHRFGSHCCETLFLESLKHLKETKESHEVEREEGSVSMEELFLRAAEELEPNMGFLLTERFASHTVRVLLLVLSGEPLDDALMKAMLSSKKKEKLEVPVEMSTESSENERTVPKTFRNVLAKLIDSAISALDTTYLRALATHPTGNPVLQLLLRLELSNSGKGKHSADNLVLRKLLPDEDLEEDTESAKFVSGLIYDPTGSHLVEILVQKLPGKAFKKLYKNVLRPRMSSMARNDKASYVAIRIIQRLGKDDLAEAKNLILPELPVLISRRRTGLITVLIERCVVRQVDLQDLSDVIKLEYGNDPAQFLPRMLDFASLKRIEESESYNDKTPLPTLRANVHGSLLAQAMLQSPEMSILVQESLLALDTGILIEMSQISASSRVIQEALSPTRSDIQFRRKFVPRFYDHILELSQDLAGSYVVDALWPATDGLHFIKERLAKELANNEISLRESPYGRNVWKNWAMDSYRRRPGEWRALARGREEEQAQSVELDGDSRSEKKTPIQLARERHAQKQSHAVKRNNPAASTKTVVPANA
ncbi:uncharacterized protein Z518_09787 [Rhinocladiella mackenziei CBS 650.93]|uniref:Nucleolar protein 9 n=1 Tax=Rhinocladiella mackenziei CBS 650.93 TaxID=1442369 RepID=A0A0D2FFC9_9EURO|nr:uncharacterized protein Z518_09787 [Rhinocladiella mackenziei CBS 650.93]KIX00722.1 hypothetical protein Z518_09787 [Rhinocladiella mackenziei CBS 650.93]